MKKYFLSLLILIFVFPALASDKLTASERVLKTNTLKCGYATANPYMFKDLNTGDMKGIYTEILLEAAKLLSLNIEWVEEPGYSEFAEGMKVGRYDAFCAPIGIIPSRTRVSISSIPLVYNPQFMYILRGKKILKNYNLPEIKAATTDGEAFQILTQRFLPKATLYSLPTLTPPTNLMMEVATGKADVVIHDPVYVNDFNKMNKDKYTLIATTNIPLSVVPSTSFTVLPEDTQLLNMMNVAFQTLLDNGKVEEILMKYDVTPNILYRITPQYKKQD